MNAPSPWGAGDLISIATGIVVLVLGLVFVERRRNFQSAAVLLGTGISLGPLLLIVFDPVAQIFGYGTSLLSIVLNEGRTTLWWAAFVASLYLVRDIL
jgi:hypothetical protein